MRAPGCRDGRGLSGMSPTLAAGACRPLPPGRPAYRPLTARRSPTRTCGRVNALVRGVAASGCVGRVSVDAGAASSGESADLPGRRERAVLAFLLSQRGHGGHRRPARPRGLGRAGRPIGARLAAGSGVAAARRCWSPIGPRAASPRCSSAPGAGTACAWTPTQVDAGRFERAVTPSRTTRPGSERRRRAGRTSTRRSRSAPGRRTPSPPTGTWSAAEVARRHEEHLAVVEVRAEAMLGLGRRRSSVGDLEALPGRAARIRERAWRLLALALYRTGRQAEALATVREAPATPWSRARRRTLRRTLRSLELDLLAQAASLETARPAAESRPRRGSPRGTGRPAGAGAGAGRPGGGPRAAGPGGAGRRL